MGRRKIEMKKIEDKSSRQVTFSKRRSGLIKKARELSVLCDIDVAVLVFSNRGRLYEFVSTSSSSSSPSSSLSQILKRYQDSAAADGKASMIVDETEQSSPSSCTEFQTSSELVKTVGRYLEGPDIENLNLNDFMQLERQLTDALVQTRNRKAQLMLESMATLHEKEKMLQQENEQLKDEVAKLMDTSSLGKHTEPVYLIGNSNNNENHAEAENLVGNSNDGNHIEAAKSMGNSNDGNHTEAAKSSDNSNNGNHPDIDLNSMTAAAVNAHIQCPKPVRTLPLLW